MKAVRACHPPAEYNMSLLELLVNASCSPPTSERGNLVSLPHASACADVMSDAHERGSLAGCSSLAKATHVLAAQWHLSRGTQCCNLVESVRAGAQGPWRVICHLPTNEARSCGTPMDPSHEPCTAPRHETAVLPQQIRRASPPADGKGSRHTYSLTMGLSLWVCHRQQVTLPWVSVPPVLLVLAVIIAFLTGRCKVRATKVAGLSYIRNAPPAADTVAAPAAAVPSMVPSDHRSAEMSPRVVVPPGSSDAHVRDAKLAELLLNHLLSAEGRAARAATARELTSRFGFQPANVANQLEHLDSLLLSELSVCANFEQAVLRVHDSLLGPFERWRILTSMASARSSSVPGRLSAWESPDIEKLLRELLLFLLIWG